MPRHRLPGWRGARNPHKRSGPEIAPRGRRTPDHRRDNPMSEGSISQSREALRLKTMGRSALAIGQHLSLHPELPIPQLDSDGWFFELASAADVLAWAKTCDSVTVTVIPGGRSCTVLLLGQSPAGSLDLTAVDSGDLYRWHDTAQTKGSTDITVDQLAAYVAAGSVDLVHEHLAVTR